MSGGGMFTRTLIFLFCFIGIFALLVALIPIGFIASPFSSSAGSTKTIASRFDMGNITVYNTRGTDNMTYPYGSLSDAPDPPQWLIPSTTDDFLEVWWAYGSPWGKMLQFRHSVRHYIPWIWYSYHFFAIYYADTRDLIEGGNTIFNVDQLTTAWNDESNSSNFYLDCTHIYASVMIGIYNTSRDGSIEEAWINGEMTYAISYEKNWNATNINAFTLLASLIMFQAPDLGIGGIFGQILNLVIALPFWIITVIAIIKLIQSLIPWIKGVED